MEEYNFEGVPAASGISMTMPGTIGLFDISKVEFGVSKTKGTPYMQLTFQCKERRDVDMNLVKDDSSFNHKYYLSSADAIKRIQYLAKVMYDNEFAGRLNETQLTNNFLNKQVALKVCGQTGTNGKGYPDLSYAGYAKKASEFKSDPSILSFNAQETSLIAEALDAMKSSRSSNADSEGPAPEIGAGKKIF